MTTYLIEKLSLDLVKKIEKMKTEMEYDPLKHTYTEFAIKGCLEGIQWLHYKRIEGCTHWAMEEAACYGHLEVVKWLHSNRTEGCTPNAMDYAARGGHLEVVQWLHSNRTEGCTQEAMDGAASNGHLEVVKWLHSNRSEGCTFRACLSSVNIWLKCKLNRIKTFIYTFINNYRKQTEME
jgi:hypothetical protein